MGYHSPRGWNARAIVKDDSLEHQIRLAIMNRMVGLGVSVSCTCRPFKDGQGFIPYDDVVTSETNVMDIWRRHHPEEQRANAQRESNSVARVGR